METSPQNINLNSSSGALNRNIDISHIKDEHLPKILFLATKTNQEYSTKTTEKIKSLTDKFEKCLKNKDIDIIRRTLQDILLTLQCHQILFDPKAVLKNNFLEDWEILSDEEEDILEFNVIFQMFSTKLPHFLEKKFNKIVELKKIAINVQDEGCHNTFILSSVNKVLSEICDMLNTEDVFCMYKTIKMDEEQDFLVAEEETMFLTTNEALKNVAFYYIILNMIKARRLNRLHTHILENVLLRIKTTYLTENERDLNRFDLALRKLERYPLSSNPPGICIIFIMATRPKGLEYNIKIVKELFGEIYNYHVICKENSTSQDVKEIAKKLQVSRNKFYDSLIVWFMGESFSLKIKRESEFRKEFLDPFFSISWLNKKPKIFFFQRYIFLTDVTPQADTSMMRLDSSDEWNEIYGKYVDSFSINNYADTLIFGVEQLEDFRDQYSSFYVQTVLDLLKEYGHCESIENILRKVGYITNNSRCSCRYRHTRTITSYESSLQKEFIFPTPE